MTSPKSFMEGKYWSSKEFRDATEKTAQRTKRRTGVPVPQEPEERINSYIQRFTDIFERTDEKSRKEGIEALERLLERKYVIAPEQVSDEYIKGVLLGNFAEQKGYERDVLKQEDTKDMLMKLFEKETKQSFATYVIPEQQRHEVQYMAVADQKTRMKSWLSYLTSEETRTIPPEFRYWAFAEMLKLGSYDEDRKIYNKRTETTAASFPELDQQALALVFDEIARKQKKEPSVLTFTDEETRHEFEKRLKTENFGKLYALMQEHVATLRLPTQRLVITSGSWRTFPKNSSASALSQALAGFNTKWCIAGEGTAAGYLQHSDIHIYFSEDAEGQDTIPRACIVHSQNRGITEVRGIMSNANAKQHLDDYITPVVEQKLATISDGEKWTDTITDMKRLAAIHLRHQQREQLQSNDLRFLYEIDRKIHSSGYDRDPRIDELISGRDTRDDLAHLFNVSKDKISLTKEEALKGGMVYHYGYLDLRGLTSAEGLHLPESVGGGLDLSGLTSAEGLHLPESVGGGLDLRGLTSAEGLHLPESVGGGLYLSGLTSAKGLHLSESVGGYLDLSRLTSAQRGELREKYPHLSIQPTP